MLSFSLNAGYLPVTRLVCYAASKLSEKSEARATYEMTHESDAGALYHFVSFIHIFP